MSNDPTSHDSGRRAFFETASGLGAALALGGVAAPALAAATPGLSGKSKYGKGAALEGPYLDLRTGKGNQLAYARIQGAVEPEPPQAEASDRIDADRETVAAIDGDDRG